MMGRKKKNPQEELPPEEQTGEIESPPEEEVDDGPGGENGDAALYRENLLRLQAEFENYKKRQVREREDHRKYANEKILTAFLPVLDNLERAVGHAGEEIDPGKLLEGVQLVLKQLREGFAQYGVELIDAEGVPFDPHIHEAMSRVETDGDPPDGTIVEVYQKGYLLHGRVLRPAMVSVAKIVDGDPEGEGEA